MKRLNVICFLKIPIFLSSVVGLMLISAGRHSYLSAQKPKFEDRVIDASFDEKALRPAGIRQSIGSGMARFAAEGVDIGSLPASLAVTAPIRAKNGLPEDFGIEVYFHDAPDDHTAFVPIEPGTSLYGTGEIAGPLLRNGRITQTWNYDAFAYDKDFPQLYQSHPWALAVGPDGRAFGALADTTYRCLIDLSRGIRFKTEGHPFAVYVLAGRSPQEVLKKLAASTGTMSLPPRWALGYHQCRWSYHPESKVREIAEEFRRRGIPCDVIWLDIDYMDGFRIFTFDRNQFPNPKALNADLRSLRFHTVWMIDPGVKKEPGYFVYDQGSRGDHWVGLQRRGLAGGVRFPGFHPARDARLVGRTLRRFHGPGGGRCVERHERAVDLPGPNEDHARGQCPSWRGSARAGNACSVS